MNCGYFDDETHEYVITDPRTPVKWINYMGSLAFGGLVDQTGGALICKGDPALNRITRYVAQMPAGDFRGSTLYLKVTPGQREPMDLFSPFYVPTLKPFDRYECRVGLGYSRFISQMFGIMTEITLFVPPESEVLLQDVRITNLREQGVEVVAIPVVEYSHFDALKQFTNADWVPQTMQSQAYPESDGCLVLAQYAYMRRDTAVNYFTSNRPVSSFETDRRAFLGANEYGSWANPLSLEAAELGNSEAQRGDNIGALMQHVKCLEPGKTVRLITQLGQARNVEAARASIVRYRQPEAVDEALDELGGFWKGYLARQQVHTPDPSLNRMLNIHNPYQVYITRNWSRYLSLYQLGYGARGIGFRDSAQDTLGAMANDPLGCLALIRLLLQVQKIDGSAMHQFNPLTMVANEGDSRESEEGPFYYSDDHLWIVLAVAGYLKETGDLAILDEEIPFYERGRDGKPLEKGTVMEHLRRALAFTKGDLGQHGLPRLGFADWNDTVNLPVGAESVFTACLYGLALQEMVDLTKHLGQSEAAARYITDYETMRETINEKAWDGGWYRRYFDYDGKPLGSAQNQHGQIFLNAQSWPVIAGFATKERARQALDAVYDRLNTRFGIKLSAPGFEGYDPSKGGVTTYPPGAKENGGIFLHANPWAIIAETRLGNGPRAYQYYNQINPAAHNDEIEIYECEPYVYPQNILGNEHPQFGLARNSWLTGTASWVYQAGTQYILGVRPTYAGLKVDPCIPPDWDSFEVTRQFRDAEYHIQVENPEHVSRGVSSLTVGGQVVKGDIIPPAPPGAQIFVRVVLGERLG